MYFIKPNILRTVLVTSFLTSSVRAKDESPKIVPTSYDVHLYNIDLESGMSYEGNVTIGMDVIKSVDEIKLNVRDLEVISVLVRYTGMRLAVEDFKIDTSHERLVIKLDRILPGSYTVTITFRGSINSKSVGFFKTRCRSGDKISWISGARLEPVNARSVFPCLDVGEENTEISVKLSLGVQYTVVSRFGTLEVSGDLQTLDIRFGKINIDQVAWAIYPNDGTIKVESIKGPQGHKVVTCRSNWEWLDIEMISNVMSEYAGTDVRDTQWIIMPDLPVPVSSSEGLVFIRESLVEYSNYTSMNDYFENTLSIAEGYAEQWLGQSIRTKSWSDLWLVKGLANFLKFKLTDKIASGMNVTIDSYIVSKIMPRVLEREVIPHSLTKDDADSKNDVLAMYDQDLFDRAGLIMRMIEDRIGENAFRAAINNFINITKMTGTASSNTFFNALSNASLDFPEGKTAGDAMQAWISSGGYPILSARREGNWIIVTQKSSIMNHKDNKGYWWVPVTVTSQNMRNQRKIWLRPTGTLKINLPSSDAWYMINEDGKGFYRVNYEAENWKKLSEAISNNELSEIAKARLLDDSLGLAEDGHLPYSIGLGLTRHLSDENDESLSWLASMRHLVTVRSLLEASRKSAWEEYVASLVRKFTLKHTDEMADSNEMTEGEISEQLFRTFYRMYQTRDICWDNRYCGDIIEYFMATAREKSYTMKYGGDMLDGVLCLTIEKNNSTIWETWLDTYMTFESPALESKIINGLSCTKDNSLQHRLLHMFLEMPSDLKRQDFVTFIQKLGSTGIVPSSYVVSLLTSHINKFPTFISGDQVMLSDAILVLSEDIYEPPMIVQTKALISSWQQSGVAINDLNHDKIHRAIRRIEYNGERRKRSSNDITKWLKNRESTDMDFEIPSSSPNSVINICLLFISLVAVFYYY